MRLIDADALLEELKKTGRYFQAKFDIENAPTVEANSIIDGLNNQIDDLSENLAWYVNERNRLLKERRLQDEFTLKELSRWLIAQGYSEGTVEDKIEDFGRFVKRIREDEG